MSSSAKKRNLTSTPRSRARVIVLSLMISLCLTLTGCPGRQTPKVVVEEGGDAKQKHGEGIDKSDKENRDKKEKVAGSAWVPPGGKWVTTEKRLLSAEEAKNGFVPGSLRVSPDGTRYAFGRKSDDEAVWVVDGKAGPALREFRIVGGYFLSEFHFSGDSRHYVYGDSGGDANLYVDGKVKYGPKYSFTDLVISHDGQSVSYITNIGFEYYRFVDGENVGDRKVFVWPGATRVHFLEGKLPLASPYRGTSLITSANGATYAYVGSRDGDVVVVNGTPHKHFGEVNAAPVLSADGKHVLYPAGKGVAYDNKWFDTGAAPDLPLTLSPDGKRWACRVGQVEWHSGRQKVFVDGVAGKEYYAISENLTPNGPGLARPTTAPVIVFSPDGKQVAYAAVIRFEDEKKATQYANVMVKDGVEQKRFGWVSHDPVFSPDGRHLAYLSADAANGDGGQHLTVDGVRVGKGYKSALATAFSPDSKSIGFIGKRPGDMFAVLDNQEQEAFDVIGPEKTRVGFTPDGRFTFIGIRAGAYYWVEARRK